jgi:adenylate cyclase
MIGEEFERRFLALAPPGGHRSVAIRQGYLSSDRPTVRVRAAGGSYVLAVKGGASVEIELPLDAEHGRALLQLAGSRVVRKRRHFLDGWEIDVFAGRWTGLVIAEIELEAADAPLPACPPGQRLLREITGSRHLSNAALSRQPRRAARAMIEDLYLPHGFLNAFERADAADAQRY